jgi:membrane-associated phospholipid phosphatase
MRIHFPVFICVGSLFCSAQIGAEADPQPLAAACTITDLLPRHPILKLEANQEAVLLFGGVLAQLTASWRFHSMPATNPSNENRQDLWRMDRWAAGIYQPDIARLSDILVVPVVGALPLADAWLAWRDYTTWGLMAGDALVLTEALAWSSALNLMVRSFRWHPRPLVFSEQAPDAVRTHSEAGGSFYSGHANAAFLGATLFATVLPQRFPKVNPVWVWGGSMAAAAGVAGLRVAAGKHYPTDILVGAAAGSAFALLFTYLHRSEGNSKITPEAIWSPTKESGAMRLRWSF